MTEMPATSIPPGPSYLRSITAYRLRSITSGTAALPSLNHSARSPVIQSPPTPLPTSAGPSGTPLQPTSRTAQTPAAASLLWAVPDSASDHVRITSCVCVVRCGPRAHPALQSEAAAGVCSGVFSAPFAAASRRVQAVANTDLSPLPTYQQHSAGSPAVKGAPRPTPKGLTAGEAVLQSSVGWPLDGRLNSRPSSLGCVWTSTSRRRRGQGPGNSALAAFSVASLHAGLGVASKTP